MDVAIGMFYPRVRLIGVRLPREESPFIPYLERATTLMENALLGFFGTDSIIYNPVI